MKTEIDEVWGLQLFAPGPGNAAGFDGGEAEASLVVGGDAAVACEARLQWFVLRVVRMRVLSVRVGLPDFEHAVRDRLAVAIEDAPVEL